MNIYVLNYLKSKLHMERYKQYTRNFIFETNFDFEVCINYQKNGTTNYLLLIILPIIFYTRIKILK
jgi:hypothetical protein